MRTFHRSLICSLLAICTITLPLRAQITIDGTFDDWDSIPALNDILNDGQYFDFQKTKVTSDNRYVYFYIESAQTFQLNSEYGVKLYVDVDNNASTGSSTRGLGADLIWSFADRSGTMNGATVQHADQKMFPAPTVTSNRFEIAFDRTELPGLGDTLRFYWSSLFDGDDFMPNTYHLIFEVQNTAHFYPPISLDRDPNTDLRVMTFNVLFDGVTDPNQQPAIARMIQAVNPDIITFNELWDTEAYEVTNFLNSFLPNGSMGWNAVKLFPGNVTASRYPIAQSLSLDTVARMLITEIDVPSSMGDNILVANLHLKCCDADLIRQDQVDRLASFYRDYQTQGGMIDMPVNTPLVVMGDMNLVGDRQQLETILTGDIIDEALYGADFAPEWDGSPLTDALALHSHRRSSYTWPGTTSSFYPGRLDFVFYSDYVLEKEKAFVLDPSAMTNAQLQQYQLYANDAQTASDHLPVIVDFRYRDNIGLKEEKPTKFKVYPNPTEDTFVVSSKSMIIESLELQSLNGQAVKGMKLSDSNYMVEFDVSDVTPGNYVIVVNNKYASQVVISP